MSALIICHIAALPRTRVEIRDGKLYSSRKLSLYGYKEHEELSSVIKELAAKV